MREDASAILQYINNHYKIHCFMSSQYYVKWVGYGDKDNTWQLARSMKADMTKVKVCP